MSASESSTVESLENIKNYLTKDNLKIIFYSLLLLVALFFGLYGVINISSFSKVNSCHDYQKYSAEPDNDLEADNSYLTASSSAYELAERKPQDEDIIIVDIGGEVISPGIYELVASSRLATLIDQAGGFSSQAHQQYIHQQLNLAQTLNDGDKVYIPSVTEFSLISSVQSSDSSSIHNSNNSQLVNNVNRLGLKISDSSLSISNSNSNSDDFSYANVSLNNASLDELMSLNGVGEKRAADIVENRPFINIDELLLKKLVPESVFEDNQSRITL